MPTIQPVPAAQTAATGADPDAGRWEIARQWKLAWRALKWTFYGGLVMTALVIVGQVYLFYGLFAALHPWLGGVFVAAVTLALIWLVIVPAARFMRMPATAKPPEIDLTRPDLSPDDLSRRLKFDAVYLRALKKNPLLAERKADVEAALKAIVDVPLAAPAVAAFEREHIEALLGPLDKEVDRYIHAEATGVGAATAISMNGSIDAFIVLWRNVNMVSRVARMYYGRPSLRASALVLRDIAGAVILSRALEDVSEMAGEALGGVLGKLGGMVAGPLMDGSVNALVTLKIGYLAKRRCRSFEAWSPKRKANVLADVFRQLQNESASMTDELIKTCSGLGDAAASAGAKALAAPRSAWARVQNLIARKPNGPGVLPETDER